MRNWFGTIKIKKQFKKMFTKEQLLFIKKFPHLYLYNLPYPMVIRAYRRYIKNIDNYILVNDYPSYWFGKNKRTFANAVKLYIDAKKSRSHIWIWYYWLCANRDC